MIPMESGPGCRKTDENFVRLRMKVMILAQKRKNISIGEAKKCQNTKHHRGFYSVKALLDAYTVKEAQETTDLASADPKESTLFLIGPKAKNIPFNPHQKKQDKMKVNAYQALTPSYSEYKKQMSNWRKHEKEQMVMGLPPIAQTERNAILCSGKDR